MRVLALVLFGFAAVVLSVAVAPEIEILGSRPDFLVLLVVYAGLLLGPRSATIAGFITGLVVDSQLPEYLGLNALALCVTGYAASFVWKHLVRVSIVVQIAILFAATLLRDTIYYTIYYRHHLDMFGALIVRHAVLGGLYTALAGALIYTVCRFRRWEGLRSDSGW